MITVKLSYVYRVFKRSFNGLKLNMEEYHLSLSVPIRIIIEVFYKFPLYAMLFSMASLTFTCSLILVLVFTAAFLAFE